MEKAKLDHIKTDEIQTCLDVFPPKQYETTQMIDQEIREGINEMCHRTKQKLGFIIGQLTSKHAPIITVT